MTEKGRAISKNQRSANISIEGRVTKGWSNMLLLVRNQKKNGEEHPRWNQKYLKSLKIERRHIIILNFTIT
jgi:hypothetical protein